jgi:hypothetical protein
MYVGQNNTIKNQTCNTSYVIIHCKFSSKILFNFIFHQIFFSIIKFIQIFHPILNLSSWYTILYIKANVVSVCLSVCSSQTFADCGQGSGMKELYVRPSVRPFVRLPFFFSFFLGFCLSVRPSVSPSVHPSFFPSLTSPSSLAPFSVSLIYIFLVSFSGSHVIGLLNMCSNVHTTAYMQLLDFFYCQFFCQFCT